MASLLTIVFSCLFLWRFSLSQEAFQAIKANPGENLYLNCDLDFDYGSYHYYEPDICLWGHNSLYVRFRQRKGRNFTRFPLSSCHFSWEEAKGRRFAQRENCSEDLTRLELLDRNVCDAILHGYDPGKDEGIWVCKLGLSGKRFNRTIHVSTASRNNGCKCICWLLLICVPITKCDNLYPLQCQLRALPHSTALISTTPSQEPCQPKGRILLQSQSPLQV